MSKIILEISVFFLILFFGFNSTSFGFQLLPDLQEENFINKYRFGYIEVNKVGTGLFSWTPELEIGDFSLAVDFNLPMGDSKPYGTENIVLRRAEYDGGVFGICYGILDDLTFGAGLLMKKYNSWSRGPLILNNRQTGVTGFYSADILEIEGFGAWNNVYGLRLSEELMYSLTLGQSIIADADGMKIEAMGGGGAREYPAMVGYSVDARIPVIFDFELYSEMAHLGGHGSAYSVGLLWGFKRIFAAATVRVEKRFVDHDFIPNYFNSDYEINPIYIDDYSASKERKDGILVELRTQAPGVAFLDVIYEYYEGSDPTFTQEATLKLFNFFISAYFKQPSFHDFRELDFDEGTIFKGSVGYKFSNSITVYSSYKKAYNPFLGQIDETNFFEVELVI